jgi:AcrR family transcriptional regulator
MRRKILDVAAETVASDGLAASTAVMAKRAGIAQGSIFHHFETKSGLLNALFLDLKAELRGTVTADLPDAEIRERLQHVWLRWTAWGTDNPVRRRALTTLLGSDMITADSDARAADELAVGVRLFEEAGAGGPLDGQPLHFLSAVVAGVAYATMESMERDPGRAAALRTAGFDALWNMLRPR